MTRRLIQLNYFISSAGVSKLLKSIKKSVGRDEGLGLLHHLWLFLSSSPVVSGDALSGTPEDLLRAEAGSTRYHPPPPGLLFLCTVE